MSPKIKGIQRQGTKYDSTTIISIYLSVYLMSRLKECNVKEQNIIKQQ